MTALLGHDVVLTVDSIDVATGCTPIVLAIRHNHHDTVRELLTAGAIVPPPGLTSDPLMISTLYPSPHASMFGSMPYGQPMPPPEYFYFQQMDNGRMYNRHGMNGPMQGMQGMPNGGRSDQKRNGGANGNGPMSPDSTSNGGSANLPPADVAKTIPCRNFPNCKYGSSCVFFHPPGRPDQGMYGAHTMNGYHPNGGPGFDGQDGYARGMQFGFQGGFPQQGFQPQHRMSLSTSQLPDLHEQNDTGIPLVPGGEIRFDSLHISENGPNNGGRDIQHLIPDANSTDNSSSMTSSQVLEPPSESAASAANDTQTSSMVNSTGGVNIPTPNMPPPGAPPFVPGLHVPPHEMTSPPPPHAQFGASPLSPISPSMLSASLPSIPPAEAFFASTSPTNPGFSPIATGYPQPPFTHSSIMPNGLSQVMPQGIPGMQPNAQMPGVGSIVGGPHTRRQSFGQPFGISVAQLPMGPGPKFGQHKKPSFSSGPRPFRSSMGGGNGSGGVNLGSWKDGNPPPCAFFAQGKCRNGEFCKFPHLDEQGNDCRHPDVVRGIIPPLPSLGRQSRSVRHSQSGFPMPYESNFRNGQHQHLSHQHVHQQSQHISYSMMQAQHQFQANHHTQHISQQPYPQQMNNDGSLYGQNTSPDPNISSGGNLDPSASAFSTPDPSSLQNSTHLTPPPNAYPAAQPGSTKSLLGSSTVPASPMLPAITRSASQPGLQRVHATGFVSRSQSPAPSNVSFHGNGHPRRGISRGGISNVQNRGSGNRSASGDRVQVPQLPQRVPGADEFPALGGSPALNGSSGKESPTPAGQGKTAAQVLSAPAPFRPAKVDDKADDEVSPDLSLCVNS